MKMTTLRSKIQNLFFLMLCMIRFILFGKADKKPASVRRVLIVPTGKLGDVVCTTPVFHALRAALPHAEIVIEDTRGINARLLENSGLVDRYIPFKSFFKTVRTIRSLHIDTAFLTGPDFFALACIYVAGVPFVVAPRVEGGYSPYETKPYKWLSRFIITTPFHMGAYAPRERLRVLEPIGIHSEDTTKHLGYSEVAHQMVSALLRAHALQEKHFAIISPGAGNKIKRWPSGRFAHVADHIFAVHHMPIVIIGTKVDREEVQAMRDALSPQTSFVDTSEQLSIDELKALIAQAALFISVDTGPIYIAEAFGVPTIDIIGPIDEHEQPPIGSRNRVVAPRDRRRPELYVMNAREYNVEEARRQSESAIAEMVIDEVDDIFNLLNRDNDTRN